MKTTQRSSHLNTLLGAQLDWQIDEANPSYGMAAEVATQGDRARYAGILSAEGLTVSTTEDEGDDGEKCGLWLWVLDVQDSEIDL